MTINLRPSGASRWLACPASLLLEAQAPVVKSNDNLAAYLGTATHELLECCVNAKTKPDKYRGAAIEVYDEESMEFSYTIEVNQRMIDSVQLFLDYVDESRLDEAHFVASELRMDHTEIEGLGGTADYVRIYANGVADLYDLKNGTAPVQAVSRAGIINKQLLSYAALLVNKFPQITKVRAAIVSPNVKTKKKVREVEISLVDITHHELDCIEVVQYVEEITPSTIIEHSEMGSHCYFCRARGICPLKAKTDVEKEFDKI